MTLTDGFYDVPKGKVATVVTDLEMRSRPPVHEIPAPEGWALKRHETPRRDWYLRTFRGVGEDWLWFSRVIMAPDALDAILNDPKVHVYTLHKDGAEGGLLELDFRTAGQCELAYFGLFPALIGTGAGRYLMNCAIGLAWAQAITRFHLHTCTLDSPQALGFYRRCGFVPVRQRIEIADDPRVAHGFDRSLAPHVPIIE